MCLHQSPIPLFMQQVQQERLLHFYGFRDHLWGRACYALCCLVSLQWLALIFLLLIDFYQGCQVGGIDNLCFFGTHFIFGGYDLNAQVGPTLLQSACVALYLPHLNYKAGS